MGGLAQALRPTIVSLNSDISSWNNKVLLVGDIKAIRFEVSTATNRMLLWGYTDSSRLQGYRIDFNGSTKTVGFDKVTDGNPTALGVISMS